MIENLGLTLSVAGEIRPYVIKDEETGEVVSGMNVLYPGGKVGVTLPLEVAEKMQEGQTWRISGKGSVSAAGKVRIAEITEAKQLAAEMRVNGGAAFEFLDDAKPTARSKA
ncbi:MAG: hypothetical protein AAGG01_00850 [Planctomycetota bacterium]